MALALVWLLTILQCLLHPVVKPWWLGFRVSAAQRGDRDDLILLCWQAEAAALSASIASLGDINPRRNFQASLS